MTDAEPTADAQLPRSSRQPRRPRPRSRRKRIVFTLLMLVMTLLIIGAIGEVAARLLIGAPLPERRPLLVVEEGGAGLVERRRVEPEPA